MEGANGGVSVKGDVEGGVEGKVGVGGEESVGEGLGEVGSDGEVEFWEKVGSVIFVGVGYDVFGVGWNSECGDERVSSGKSDVRYMVRFEWEEMFHELDMSRVVETVRNGIVAFVGGFRGRVTKEDAFGGSRV
ncbi:hypothetical protein L1987_02206 [Smallanthus sonchifolius]|uniref:Uncharacterized protein n=1 Tax=Smallanthus sonchifolius TaxID=185202 RepID=A0ACB9K7B5_9ASTR|nr:hypothetical protein L1987_02206 [Smallanthus sonchifolius]